MFISIEQIKAARALLKWTQKDLAAHAGLNDDQVHSYESGRTRSLEVLEAITTTFTACGIEFLNGGVMPRQVSSYVLDSYLDLLEDVCRSMPDGGEVLFHCGDDRRSPPEVVEKQRQMHRAGFRARMTISEDNDYIDFNPEGYRKIPAEFFKTSVDVITIYSNKVAFVTGEKIMVIISQALADLFRDQFEYWWRTGSPLSGR